MSAAIDATTRFSIPASVHARRFEDELVILDLNGGNYFSLDAIGVAIWERFAAGRSAAEVAAELVRDYDVTLERLQLDIIDLATELVERGLLVAS